MKDEKEVHIHIEATGVLPFENVLMLFLLEENNITEVDRTCTFTLSRSWKQDPTSRIIIFV